MRPSRRLLSCLFVVAALSAAPCLARAAEPETHAPIADAIAAGRWADAAILASDEADPIAADLVAYFHARAGNGLSPAEIAAFMDSHPDWPARALLARRLQGTLAADPALPPASVCAASAAPSPPVMVRCAEAAAARGDAAEAASLARHAWREGLDTGALESAFLAHWGTILTPADETARFDRLAWTDPAGAARQISRLPRPARTAAEAWLALRRGGPKEFARATALPAAARSAPGFVLERIRWLRRADQIAPAVALWHAEGFAAEAAAEPEHRAAFWAERAALARDLMELGDWPRAYALADDRAQTATGPATDAAFLAGFIALRFLHDPDRAAHHFDTLAHLSHAAITSARAAYWSAQAAMASGHADAAAAATARAAAWPTTFYGQLAAGDALAATLRTLADPPSDRDGVRAFLNRDLVRAAILLARWGMDGQAATFLRSAADAAPTPSDRALAARLALALGLPDDAVAIGRKAGVDGIMLPVSGWPAPQTVTNMLAAAGDGPDPALALGIIRQESSFDPGAMSPSGARGLMQLMPATAADVFRKRDGAEPPPTLNAELIADPSLNVTLGVTYLRELLDSYGGAAPLAVAAYNAGPHRVAAWLAANGDPRRPDSVNLIDWIELIPFDETRNYVERVLEAQALYRARLDRPRS